MTRINQSDDTSVPTGAIGTSPRWWHMMRGAGAALMLLGWCAAASASQQVVAAMQADAVSLTPEKSHMWMTLGERRFAIALADDATARALTAQLPLTLEMRELNGNEKHAELPKALPTAAKRPGTIRTGDLMLYGATTLVVFYETFDSSYAYTRLGRIEDAAGLIEALGRGDVRVVFSED